MPRTRRCWRLPSWRCPMPASPSGWPPIAPGRLRLCWTTRRTPNRNDPDGANRPDAPGLDELDRSKRQLEDPGVAGDPNADPASDGVAVQEALEVTDAFDRPAIELENQVARTHPG